MNKDVEISYPLLNLQYLSPREVTLMAWHLKVGTTRLYEASTQFLGILKEERLWRDTLDQLNISMSANADQEQVLLMNYYFLPSFSFISFLLLLFLDHIQQNSEVTPS